MWTVSIGVPFIGMLFYRTLSLKFDNKCQTKKWILDDDISFVIVFSTLFVLCYGVASYLSARISLPKRSSYDICDYDLEIQECTKVKRNEIL